MDEDIIKHEGIVSEVEEGKAIVKLVNISACSSCHAKSVCNVSETDNKEIEVLVESESVKVGDHIHVLLNEHAGVKALLLGYVVPFFVMMTALIATWIMTANEVETGLSAVLVLVPYYLVLALFKKRFSHAFSFKLEKLKTLT